MLARACNPVSAQRIARDPAFARTRENGTEFGMVSRAGKLLRDGLKGFLRDVPTDELDLRVMRKLMDIKAQDTVSARGQRQVGVALGLKPALLGGLVLSSSCGLNRFVTCPPVVDRQTGTITLPDFPIACAPRPATHVLLTGFRGHIDFSSAAETSASLQGGFSLSVSEEIVLSLDEAFENVVLALPEPEGTSGIEIWGMKIAFLQEINGIKYVLESGAAGILESFSAGPIPIERPSDKTIQSDSIRGKKTFKRKSKTSQPAVLRTSEILQDTTLLPPDGT